MKPRYFIVIDLILSKQIISEYNMFKYDRERKIDELRVMFGAVGFTFGHDGTPEYLLLDQESKFDTDMFESTTISRGGTNLIALTPKSTDLCKVMNGLRVTKLKELLVARLPYRLHTHKFTDSLKVHENSDGNLLVMVVGNEDCTKFNKPVQFEEVDEIVYNKS